MSVIDRQTDTLSVEKHLIKQYNFYKAFNVIFADINLTFKNRINRINLILQFFVQNLEINYLYNCKVKFS